MLAKLARELPSAPGLAYEPKWDGFRCVAFTDGREVDLRSRNDRPLARYFPEVVAAVAGLGAPVVLDGELVVTLEGRADFPALLARLHPAASRVDRLAAETPARFVAFDLLAADGSDLLATPYVDRRRRLEALLHGVSGAVALSPSTTDVDVAARWLDMPPGSAVDGVVVKRLEGRYEPDRRTLVKVKRERTVDCVVAGFRLYAGQPIVGSLLLGMYDGEELVHVGVATSFPMRRRAELVADLAPLAVGLDEHPWREGFALEGGPTGRLVGAAGRWTPDMPRDWVPLRPERVAEVAYTQLDGIRFRHPAVFRRWRPDRDATSCSVDQLRDVGAAA